MLDAYIFTTMIASSLISWSLCAISILISYSILYFKVNLCKFVKRSIFLWGNHFLSYKFIERTIERWTKFTKQLLIASSRHQVPRKVGHCLRREVGQKINFAWYENCHSHSFDFHLHGISFYILSLSVCLCLYVQSVSFIESIHINLIFASTQPVYLLVEIFNPSHLK